MPATRHSAISPDNVGWNLWNMSKQISHIRYDGRRARQALDDPATTQWTAARFEQLAGLSAQLDALIPHSDSLWQRLLELAQSADPDLVGRGEVSVIKNHGDDPVTMDAIWGEWAKGRRVIEEGWRLDQELKRVLGDGSDGGPGRGGTS